ncbi:MAG: hypothetical protein O3A51_09940, partial [Verrucomicrobia bacterium]|nr:hypothetical protein [Verrucomicrobiota bacterium]
MKRKAKAETIITVSPSGSDRWAGTLAEPNARKTNGPLKTLRAAQRVARRLKREGPVRIVLRGGIYFQRAPLVFKPGDGGLAESAKGRAGDSAGQPVVWQAYPGETPVISGGKRIDGWRVETLNGRPVWVATLPAVARGTWRFRQLWVNGRRAARTRLPKTGFYRITRIPGATFTGSWPVAVFKGQDQFGFRDGDIRPWHNLDDVEFVALHFWIETRRQLR